MLAQVLNRSFVLEQLRKARKQLEVATTTSQTRSLFFKTYPDMGPEDLGHALSSLRQAELREENQSSGQRGFIPSDVRRNIRQATSLDDVAFFSRDPIVNIFQSILDEYLEAHPEELPIVKIQPPDASKPLDFPVADRSLAALPPSGTRFVGEFEPGDPRWISAGLARAISLFRGKRTFNAIPASPLLIGDKVRILLVGDWGTGLPRAQKVASQMRVILDNGKASGIEQHVIHLGDVYYSGFESEYRNRFLAYWPVKTEEAETIASWSLNGNHDMYSGGHAYYDFLLKDVRFKRQEQSSFFRLYNEFWDILALDTSWDDAGLIDRRGVLKDPQADWIRTILSDSNRKAMLLSHHQLFSAYDSPDDILKSDPQIKGLLDTGRIVSWFWGHEHRCMLFEPYEAVPYGRCLGNGGVPVYMPHSPNDPYPVPGKFEYRASMNVGTERWALFGFAVLDFNGAKCDVSYIDENGTKFSSETIDASASLKPGTDPTRSASHRNWSPSLDQDIVGAEWRKDRKSHSPREGTSIVRYPSIMPRSQFRPGEEVSVAIDLLIEKPQHGPAAEDVSIRDLPRKWDEIRVDVHIDSDCIEFRPDATRGEIIVRNSRSSIPYIASGRLQDNASSRFNIVATFYYNARFCGKVRLRAEVSPATRAPLQARSLGAAASFPEANQSPQAAAMFRGSFRYDSGAKTPFLTVRIAQPEGPESGRLSWNLQISRECGYIPGLPGLLRGDVDLEAKPEKFFRDLYKGFGALERKAHVRRIDGFGETLYDKSPQCFKETYRAMRAKLGASFPIQFVTDEPYIPWELMRPTGWETKEMLLLAECHPVARWISDYEGWMPSSLPRGEIVTVAPDYSRRKIDGVGIPPLPQAILESKMLVENYHAMKIDGTMTEVMNLLETTPRLPVGILHFAGHGSFGQQTAADSKVYLSDQDLGVMDIRRAEVILGKRCGTLVIFNACEVGASGSVLGSIGGWAEAFLRGGFSGFVGPLWSVYDDDAVEFTREFFQKVRNEQISAGQALQLIRKTHGRESATFLAYLYYGDVMASVS